MLSPMRARTALAFAVVAGYVGFLAHTTAGTQCPMRTVGPCAAVHALFMRTRRPEPAPLVVALATPMRGHARPTDVSTGPLRLAAAGARE
jgi:uncharacterized membrane protein YoaK (UPF0700 family)